jgi:TPR repeat protein
MRGNLAGRKSTLLLILAVCSLTAAGCGRGSQFEDGQAAYRAKDFTKAASLYERACQAGEARACTSLGAMASSGEGGRKDVSWARGLYEKGCKGGDAEGCEKLRAMTAQASPAPQAAQTTAATAPAPDAASVPDAAGAPAVTGAPAATSAPEAAFVPSAHPSFDCATARNEAERLICSDDELARRDVELARLYRRARDHAADEDVVITEQRDWIALSRNVCTSKECLYRAYRHRAHELEDWIP